MSSSVPLQIHILQEGFPLCRFSNAIPKDWPAGNQWVGMDGKKDATCVRCLQECVLRLHSQVYKLERTVRELQECLNKE